MNSAFSFKIPYASLNFASDVAYVLKDTPFLTNSNCAVFFNDCYSYLIGYMKKHIQIDLLIPSVILNENECIIYQIV